MEQVRFESTRFKERKKFTKILFAKIQTFLGQHGKNYNPKKFRGNHHTSLR